MTLRANSSAYTHITTATTTQVKNGAGVLKAIIINTPANTGTVTIYDNTGGDTTNQVAIITSKTADPPSYLEYNLRFSNGLKIVTATAAQDITVVWE